MHAIRLRGPWQKQIGNGPAERVDVPEPASPTSLTSSDQPPCASTRLPDTSHTLYRRRFNRPTGLDASSRVMLRIEHWEGQLRSIQVNDHQLPDSSAPIEAEIQGLLLAHNVVEIELSEKGRLDGEVTLVIE